MVFDDLDDNRVIHIHKHGDASAGTNPLAISDAVEQKRFKNGNLVRFTAGLVLARWAFRECAVAD